ncbi:MAG: hypothetical protein D4R67_09550 [Bacteroidetes bacterium]|nr:MAG: hypothetical protein D4R67_09550 [Bacteroidota bacterium]
MEIIDLSPEYESLYCCCLEDWSDEMKEAGDHKDKWFQSIRDKGLRVKLAVDDNGVVGGMIQYLPIELSVTSFINGWCPDMNIVQERAKRAVEELGTGVEYKVIPTDTKESIREWGQSDALFINGKSVRMGPPPSYYKIRKKISKRIKQ